MHTESLDTILTQELLLPTIDIAQANIDQLLRAHNVLILHPAKDILLLLPGQPGQECHGHTVDVSAVASLGDIDIGVGVNPNDGHFAAESLADCLCCAGDGADGDGVVAAQSEYELSVLGVVVDLGAELFGHGADGAGLLHAPVVGVFGGDVILVVVNCVVVVNFVVEILAELG